jgi:hypothetical protein
MRKTLLAAAPQSQFVTDVHRVGQRSRFLFAVPLWWGS